MRILLVNYEYPPIGAGAATATHELAKALVQLGHRAVVLTSSYKQGPSFSEEEGIAVHRVAAVRRRVERSTLLEMGSFLLAGFASVRRLIMRHQIEALIVFFVLPCGPIGLLSRYTCRIPYVVSLRGGDVPGNEPSLNWLQTILAPLRRLVLKRSRAIVANSHGLKTKAQSADPFPIRVICNGVDERFFVPSARAVSRKRGQALRLLFAGRFQNQKNLRFLLQEVARLPSGTVELNLVGDGPEKGSLESVAQQLSIAPAVAWHGWLSRSQLREMYQRADCLVNPSLYEGMPNVVLEAMACGLPVIASNVPGNADVVVNGKTGFLFDLEKPGELLEKVQFLIDDPALQNHLGANARAHAVQNFSWRRAAEDYVRLFLDPVDLTG